MSERGERVGRGVGVVAVKISVSALAGPIHARHISVIFFSDGPFLLLFFFFFFFSKEGHTNLSN